MTETGEEQPAVTATGVLRRALSLIESPLPHTWAVCLYALGPCCVRCALAHAKGELDDAAGEGIPLHLAFAEVLSGAVRIHDTDAPLVEAGHYAHPLIGTGKLSRTQAIAALTEAIEASQA